MKFLEQKLPQNKLDELNRWWPSGPSHEYTKRIMLAQLWCETHLNKVSSKQLASGNCYASGLEVWERKDGAPISEDDFAAMQAWMLGQENYVKLISDGKQLERRWGIDSSG